MSKAGNVWKRWRFYFCKRGKLSRVSLPPSPPSSPPSLSPRGPDRRQRMSFVRYRSYKSNYSGGRGWPETALNNPVLTNLAWMDRMERTFNTGSSALLVAVDPGGGLIRSDSISRTVVFIHVNEALTILCRAMFCVHKQSVPRNVKLAKIYSTG